MLKFLLIANKQGKLRLSSHYESRRIEERILLESKVIQKCLSRNENQCSFLDFKDFRLIHKRYGSLHFIVGVNNEANELAVLEFLQLLVETLDTYFDKVTELHIMFNVDKVHLILREMISSGIIVETNKNRVLTPIKIIEKLDSK